MPFVPDIFMCAAGAERPPPSIHFHRKNYIVQLLSEKHDYPQNSKI